MRDLDRLFACGVKVRLKAMALCSNVQELAAIARFCRERTKDYFRFDPLLHLRFDGNARRNTEIRAERLSPGAIVAIERADEERFASRVKACDKLIVSELAQTGCDHLFHCGAGSGSFNVSYDGLFRLCSSLRHPDCVCDLRNGTLADAWLNFVPKVRDMRSRRSAFLEKCRVCPTINLRLWCPAHAHLETGEMDAWVEYFCQVAHTRACALGERVLPQPALEKEY
jgi:radical SAM protein with 4Fe4S-binding SPASM domain